MPVLNTRPIICNAELSAKARDFSGPPVNFKKSLRTQEWSDRQARYSFGIPRKFWIKPVGVVFRFFWKNFLHRALISKSFKSTRVCCRQQLYFRNSRNSKLVSIYIIVLFGGHLPLGRNYFYHYLDNEGKFATKNISWELC